MLKVLHSATAKSRWDYLKYLLQEYIENSSIEEAQEAYMVILEDIQHLEQTVMSDEALHHDLMRLTEEMKRKNMKIERLKQQNRRLRMMNLTL